MNTFKNHWAVFGFDVDSLEVGQGADSRISTVVAVRNVNQLDILCEFPIPSFQLKVVKGRWKEREVGKFQVGKYEVEKFPF